MSELHVRQIRAALEKQLQSHVDLSDVCDRVDEQTNAFLSRAQMAFVLSYLTGQSMAEAATSITDGFGDNGIDAVLYHPTERVLYIGQSKWRNDGSGSIDRGDTQKYIKGFRDLINARWERFNEKLKNRSASIETALNDASIRIVLVVAYTGQEPLSSEVNQDIQDLLEEINDPTQLVTVQVFRQSNIYAIVAQGIQGSPIDIDVALYDWGQVRDPYSAFYGQVSVSDVARWYEEHQHQLFAPNIRMFLGATEVNATIVDTLLDSPNEFWYFNNGISALCRTIKKKPIGGNTKETGIFECNDLRIVNGAQTVGAIATAAAKDPDATANARVGIRIVSLENCPPDFDRKVTRYNNTQNRIDRRDFVALDSNQERVRSELLLEGVIYTYKSGEVLTPSDKGFTLDEATVARACSQVDVSLSVQAKREIGKLWDDIQKAPYKILFNPSVSGPVIWRSVQVVREVEANLSKWRSGAQGREKLLAIHGNRFISHFVLQSLQATPGSSSQSLDAETRQMIATLTDELFGKVIAILDAEYSDSYLANLFKNVSKCQHVKSLIDQP